MVPVAPIITGIAFVFTFHMRCISIVSSLYFRIFSASFFNHISVPRNRNVYQHTCSLFIITNYNVWFVVRNCSVSLNFVDSTTWLPYHLGLFLLILVHVRTSGFCPIIIIIIIIIFIIIIIIWNSDREIK
jgi:hypothetical protein